MSLKLEDLGVSYGAYRALDSISIDIEPACLVGVVGPNGAGKSSLLKSIAGLTERSGSVSVDTLRLDTAPEDVIAKTVSYCSQSTFPAWPVTVRDIVALGRLPYRHDSSARHQDESAIELAIERMGLAELADRTIDTLSGGERARTLLARTLATDAKVLLVDEPTASLDPYHEIRTMEILRDEAERGVIAVAVLHNLALAARFCDLIMVIDAGRLRAHGPPAATLDASLLAGVYGVEALIETHDGSMLVIPWRRIE